MNVYRSFSSLFARDNLFFNCRSPPLVRMEDERLPTVVRFDKPSLIMQIRRRSRSPTAGMSRE
jgi:hypothetical protein